MSLSLFVSFQSRFVTYLLTFSRRKTDVKHTSRLLRFALKNIIIPRAGVYEAPTYKTERLKHMHMVIARSRKTLK